MESSTRAFIIHACLDPRYTYPFSLVGNTIILLVIILLAVVIAAISSCCGFDIHMWIHDWNYILTFNHKQSNKNDINIVHTTLNIATIYAEIGIQHVNNF